MAVIKELDQPVWDEWVSGRPPNIQDLCRRYPPDRLYLLTSSGHRVTVYSYNEDGTVCVSVTGKFNQVLFDRNVFGVDPKLLEECDLPDKEKELGTAFTDKKKILDYIERWKADNA